MAERLEYGHVRRGLKDFQLATVDYVFDRLYGADPTPRFLVADEVGLGKTLVARGVVAKAIESLQDSVERIDVVYVCSNAEIARQNIRRLNITGRDDIGLATRITLLPLELEQLTGSKRNPNRLNFVSFTPGTSFDLGWNTGVAKERALLLVLLRKAWKLRIRGDAPLELMRDRSQLENFRRTWREIDAAKINEELAEAFALELRAEDGRRAAEGKTELRVRWIHLRDRFGRRGAANVDTATRRSAHELIGELRRILARSCVHALEPDLIILDEFQRFKHLLDDGNAVGELAQHLFGYRDERNEQARVLLLSATPYKMLTVAGADDEDHYADFLSTYRFLVGGDAAKTDDFQRQLAEFREALLRFDDASGVERASDARDAVAHSLRRVMCRTERLGVTPDRDGMLVERPANHVDLLAADIRAYVGFHKLAAQVGAPGGVAEFWKSAPYLLEFMEGYDVIRRIERAIGAREPLELPDQGRLRWSDLARYAAIEPGNARLRSLQADTVDAGAARLLWISPSLPYYELGGPYERAAPEAVTKRLVFSSWAVVPRAVASLLSYAAERDMIGSAGRSRNYERTKRRARLLEFVVRDERPTGMPVLALIAPLLRLATEYDPRIIAGEIERTTGNRARSSDVVNQVAAAIAQRASAVTQIGEGAQDDRWYWLLPMALDQESAWINDGVMGAWLADDGDEVDDGTALAAHLRTAEQALEDLRGGTLQIGSPPGDLLDVTAQLIVGAPGIAATRALARIASEADGVAVTAAAASVAAGARTLFNVEEVTALVRRLGGRSGLPYWRLVVKYCIDGCLQSVLDEYAHVLVEHTGSGDRSHQDRARIVANEMLESISLRTTRYRMRAFTETPDGIVVESHNIRGRFALRFGDDRTEDGGAAARAHAARGAFNSPFWPHVLVSTSVGQEGLDFHLYCHALTHWNLPSNPVDMEQREGRIHRFKNHAVRRNVAFAYRDVGLHAHGDPWQAMFDAATAARADTENDLVPSWIFTGGPARIERYVPTLPLSRDRQRLATMKRNLAAYRLAFGQPRQEDLIAYIAGDASPERLETLRTLQIRLEPNGGPPA